MSVMHEGRRGKTCMSTETNRSGTKTAQNTDVRRTEGMGDRPSITPVAGSKIEA